MYICIYHYYYIQLMKYIFGIKYYTVISNPLHQDGIEEKDIRPVPHKPCDVHPELGCKIKGYRCDHCEVLIKEIPEIVRNRKWLIAFKKQLQIMFLTV